MRRSLLFAAALLVPAAIGSAAAARDRAEQQYATGVVYNDANRNGVRDQGESGLSGVRVSNGRTSVRTDGSGSYSLPVTDDTILFVIKPRNWSTPLDANNLPRFHYIHKPNGSPKLQHQGVDPTGPLPASIDFALYSRPEPDRFRAVLLGDPQVGSPRDIAYLAHDVIEELVGTDAAFGVTLGDSVADNLAMLEPLTATTARIGIPCYYVKGNHDSNYDGAPDQKLVNETFERTLGPSYYSFDYGPVHFVALDNPYFARAGGYEARLSVEQMAFLRDDLASIPREQLVVLMMHIPIMEMKDREAIFQLLETHPNTFSVAAHWHMQANFFLTKADGWNGANPHHHLVNATSCGSWWTGAADEVGIPHTTMRDGTPNGYSIVTFDGASYSVRFKAARRPADYQMNIHAPDSVAAADASTTQVLVNVFAGSARSVVEMKLGDKGAWAPMERTEVADPDYDATKKREDGQSPRAGGSLPGPDGSRHMWKASLPGGTPAGTYLIHVRAKDAFGQIDTASRVVVIR